jgi:hypothetical protein
MESEGYGSDAAVVTARARESVAMPLTAYGADQDYAPVRTVSNLWRPTENHDGFEKVSNSVKLGV